MVYVICGEDVAAARKFIIAKKEAFAEKNYRVLTIPSSPSPQLKNVLYQPHTLFEETVVYFADNLLKRNYARHRKDIRQLIDHFILSKKEDLFLWEEGKTKRQLPKIKGLIVKEFRLPASIFKLQDSLFPANKREIIALLHQVGSVSDENFIFAMINHRVRNLLISRSGGEPLVKMSWQGKKIKYQARRWPLKKLILFYNGLERIEKRYKTGQNPYSLTELVEILILSLL